MGIKSIIFKYKHLTDSENIDVYEKGMMSKQKKMLKELEEKEIFDLPLKSPEM